MTSNSRSTHRGINFREVVINPTNLKCSSLPLLCIRNQHMINFHLAWIGFFVAFLSWFAFAPLIPDVIKKDLGLTAAQIGNSNVISLCATLVTEVIIGPMIDWYGPRKVMAGLLVMGAIPSGLAGTISTAYGLYLVRFFIGVLGAIFVTCQAWTTVFFDRNVVGTANALAAGWGDAGGGVTFIVMIALYDALTTTGITPHVAWRASFAIIPVPCLLLASAALLVFGTDHPAGRWCDRHESVARPAKQVSDAIPDTVPEEDQPYAGHGAGEDKDDPEKKGGTADVRVTTELVHDINMVSELDYAVTAELTPALALKVVSAPVTWLPAFGYFTTLGYQVAIDNYLADVLLNLYKSKTFGQTKAGYIASVFGFLNVVSRPFGGYLGDVVYRYWGVPGKKYLMTSLGVVQGLLSLGLGMYIDSHEHPSLSVVIGMIVVLAVANEAANGANFSLVPHCNPRSNGFVSGIVGGMGNVGGVVYALVFRLQPVPIGKAFWISGVIAMGINVLISIIRVPRV